MKQAGRPPRCGCDIAAAVEDDKRVAVLERARRPSGGLRGGNIELALRRRLDGNRLRGALLRGHRVPLARLPFALKVRAECNNGTSSRRRMMRGPRSASRQVEADADPLLKASSCRG